MSKKYKINRELLDFFNRLPGTKLNERKMIGMLQKQKIYEELAQLHVTCECVFEVGSFDHEKIMNNKNYKLNAPSPISLPKLLSNCLL